MAKKILYGQINKYNGTIQPVPLPRRIRLHVNATHTSSLLAVEDIIAKFPQSQLIIFCLLTLLSVNLKCQEKVDKRKLHDFFVSVFRIDDKII